MRILLKPCTGGLLLLVPYVGVAPVWAQDAFDKPCNAVCQWWMSIGKPHPPEEAPPPAAVKAVAPESYKVPPVVSHEWRAPAVKLSLRKPARSTEPAVPAGHAVPAPLVALGYPVKPWEVAIGGSTPILASRFVWFRWRVGVGPR